MKKLKFFFLSLVFIFSIYKFSFVSYASFQPPVLPTNTSTFLDFISSTALTDLASHGVYVPDTSSLSKLNEIVNGRSLIDSVQTRYIDLGSTDWEVYGYLYDHEGNIVLQSDCYMGFFETDAGTGTGIFSKSTGEALRVGLSFEGSESSLMSGLIGSGGSQRFPLTNAVITSIDENNGVFCDSALTSDVRDKFQSYAFSGYCRSVSEGFVCFVPNSCSPNTVIAPFNNQYEVNWSGSYYPDSRIFTVYTNEPSEVIFVPSNTSFGHLSYISYGIGLYGNAFHYKDAWDNSYNIFWNGGEVYYKTPTESEYNSLKNSDVVYTQPIINSNDTYNEYYNYDSFTNNYPSYNTTVNNSFNYSDSISPDNYPINRSVSLGDYSPTYNYYTSYNEYLNSPNTGEDIGTIPDSNISDNLPILNNLEKRFPFSIPFDIYNLLQSLNEERITPYIDEVIVIPAINYEWHIEYDLSDFDDIAELFRTLFLISFIIGLAYFSYDHFFGS